ncbi:HalOD1 output domain-containing protein [Natronorubrum halophilum]|uniref:HalOD1 output domain-containing protein n=1 Tax=Natronorubrum halophilum TaxID=1702106 RepID=UPI000EF6ECF2|nr:HalOD1 output domain-containing protein [Natronorubrum halophilum]
MPGTMLDYHNDSISLSVIEALADATDTDPIDLEPLYHVVDPEALDQLFQGNTTANARIQFAYGEHSVEVRNDGTILIDDTVHERP